MQLWLSGHCSILFLSLVSAQSRHSLLLGMCCSQEPGIAAASRNCHFSSGENWILGLNLCAELSLCSWACFAIPSQGGGTRWCSWRGAGIALPRGSGWRGCCRNPDFCTHSVPNTAPGEDRMVQVHHAPHGTVRDRVQSPARTRSPRAGDTGMCPGGVAMSPDRNSTALSVGFHSPAVKFASLTQTFFRITAHQPHCVSCLSELPQLWGQILGFAGWTQCLAQQSSDPTWDIQINPSIKKDSLARYGSSLIIEFFPLSPPLFSPLQNYYR